MRFVAGEINKERLHNILTEAIDDCVRVRAAVAYASRDNMALFETCKEVGKPLTFYGRYDHTVPVAPEVLKWFLDQATPNLVCKLVPDILHAKVIWWEGVGAYIGSANLSDRAWVSNIEAGVYVPHEELLAQGIDLELEVFFERIEDYSRELTDELYEEIRRLAELRREEIGNRDYKLSLEFDKKRRLPKNEGLAWVDRAKSEKMRLDQFVKEWERTLQLMRDLGARISQPENRPGWMREEVPSGVQADQFLHVYYYQEVREGASHPYERFFERNKNRPEEALREAISWWKAGGYSHEYEENTVYQWAPRLRLLLGKDKLLNLTEEEFAEMAGMVHAIREHASKQPNSELGLPGSAQPLEEKVSAFGKKLFHVRSAEGKTVLETIHYVLYGGPPAELAKRLWTARVSPQWRIPHFGLSSLGEIAGWAMPERFPPRNMRSSKALMALGYSVSILL